MEHTRNKCLLLSTVGIEGILLTEMSPIARVFTKGGGVKLYKTQDIVKQWNGNKSFK